MYTNVPTSATGSFNYLTEQHVIELIFTGRPSYVFRNLIETTSTRLCTHFLTSFPVGVVVCLYAHIHVIGVSCNGKSGSGVRDRGCGIPFWGEGVSIDRKICCLVYRGKMMPSISMSMLHESCSTSPDLKSS